MYTKKTESKITICWECSQTVAMPSSVSNPEQTTSDHLLAVLITGYGRPLTILKKDQNNVPVALLDPGGLGKRLHRSTTQLEQKPRNLCTSIRDCHKSMEDTLRGLGHCIRWKVNIFLTG